MGSGARQVAVHLLLVGVQMRLGLLFSVYFNACRPPSLVKTPHDPSPDAICGHTCIQKWTPYFRVEAIPKKAWEKNGLKIKI